VRGHGLVHPRADAPRRRAGADRDVRGAQAARVGMKNRRIVPKTRAVEPLPGSLHDSWVRCGKAGCRCASGALHGPYWRRQWRERGRTRRQYVKRTDLERVRSALAAWREHHPRTRALRQELVELRRLMRLLGV
jgi:hypothetical protein